MIYFIVLLTCKMIAEVLYLHAYINIYNQQIVGKDTVNQKTLQPCSNIPKIEPSNLDDNSCVCTYLA